MALKHQLETPLKRLRLSGILESLDMRNQHEKNQASTGYRIGFKQLVIELPYDLHTIQYTYDALARLTYADYYPGMNVDASAFRAYEYEYDRAGNRTLRKVTVGGTPTETNTTYNAANQITSGGVTYDDAGRMTSDGTNAFTWDRADRLLTHQGITNVYNGLGQRVSQEVSSITTDYLLDVQPGLWKVLAETTQGNTTHFVHGPRGLQASEDPVGSWGWAVQDGLGSVRLQADANLAVDGVQHFAPYGVPFGEIGSFDAPFGFTGEQVDGNDLLYLRARQYAPDLGVFPSLDPVEGVIQRAMSMNGYSWVEGNPITRTDPSGMLFWSFPPGSGSRRRTLYDVDQYIPSNRRYGHAWIERWLEEENGFWKTHLEFPGSGRRIDAFILDQTASYINPSPLYYTAPIGGSVFEIEPADPAAIVTGYAEVVLKTSFLNAGDGNPYCLSNRCRLPRSDRWNPERQMTWAANPYAGSYSRAPYDLSQVQWRLGNRLSYRAINNGRGPERVDPNSLGASGIPEAYWILLPVPGLIIYETERQLRDMGIVLAAAIGKHLMDQYNQARSTNPQLPAARRLPGYATSSGNIGGALIIGGVVILGLCLLIPGPIDDWLLLGGALAGAS